MINRNKKILYMFRKYHFLEYKDDVFQYTKKIMGLSKKESDNLLERIFRHQEKLDLSCRFKWTENAVAILDNRCTQHYAIADFYPGRGLGHERVMDRIAIVGDQPY